MMAIVALTATMPMRLMAQASTTTSAAANLITPLTLTEVTSLHFGTMSVLTSTAGTCVLATSGTRTSTGGVNLSTGTPTSSTATYTVAGLASATYAITFPTTITVANGSNSMTISTVTLKTTSGSDVTTGSTTSTLSASGADGIAIGGILDVPAGQTTGLYSGTFTLTVAYN